MPTTNFSGLAVYPLLQSGAYVQDTASVVPSLGSNASAYTLYFLSGAEAPLPAYMIIPTTGFSIRNNANLATLWNITNAGVITITGSQVITGDVTITGNLSDTGLTTITPTRTVASGASASLKGLNVAAATITVTGTTQVTAAQGVTSLGRPTVTDASAVTIDTLATFYIANSPLAAGSVTLTNTYAIWVDDGDVRLDGTNLIFFAASAQIVPGATSLLFRNNANNATNVSITDAGIFTIARSNLVVTLGGITASAGNIVATLGSIKSASPTAGIGYATGAGGAQAQGSGSGKGTTVVSNTVTTLITMDAAALNAGVIVSFTFTNSAIAATDHILINHESGGTVGSYTFAATPGAGTSTIFVRNATAGNLSEAIVIRITVIKAVSS